MIWQFGLLVCTLVVVFAYVARPMRAASGTEIHAPHQWASKAAPIKIATYNICGGRGLDGTRDVSRSAEILSSFDISGVQELFASDWAGNPSHLEQIAKTIESGWLFAPTRSRWFREYRGNGLLSRFPADKWYREPLVDHSGHSYRNLLSARIKLGEAHVWVLVTHLHTREARELQLKYVLDRFFEYSPAILLGDLNTHRDDPALAAALARPGVNDAIAETLGDQDPDNRVDWILSRGLEITDGGMIEAGVSDHPCYYVSVAPPETR